jgi:hypothetical protein
MKLLECSWIVGSLQVALLLWEDFLKALLESCHYLLYYYLVSSLYLCRITLPFISLFQQDEDVLFLRPGRYATAVACQNDFLCQKMAADVDKVAGPSHSQVRQGRVAK